LERGDAETMSRLFEKVTDVDDPARMLLLDWFKQTPEASAMEQNKELILQPPGIAMMEAGKFWLV